MVTFLVSVIGILITIFFVIGTHEAAHFGMARALNIQVLQFSIGFGKKLFTKRDQKGTDYSIAVFPLGGFVKMLDEDDGPLPEQMRQNAFNRQPFYKKFLVIAAGPLSNLFCAVLLYWAIFLIGFTTLKPIIGSVVPSSIAAQAQIQPTQEIIAIDGSHAKDWAKITMRLLTHLGDADTVLVTTQNPAGSLFQHRLDLKNWQVNDLNPEPLESLGIHPQLPKSSLIIAEIIDGSPATLQLQAGDEVIALNGILINDWPTLLKLIADAPSQILTFKILRNNQRLIIPVKTGYQYSGFLKKIGYLGIKPKINIPPELIQTIQYSPIAAFQLALMEVKDFAEFNFILVGKMLTGKLSLKSLGGPITIFSSAGSSFQIGLVAFLGFLAFLSVSIGIINLLPIPGLDGGHLFLFTTEALIGRSLSPRMIQLLTKFGLILILIILIQAILNDLHRAFL